MFMRSLWSGRLTYRAGLELQEFHTNVVSQTGEGVLLGLEHEPVLTLGRRMKSVDEAMALNLSGDNGISRDLSHFEVVQTDRGGEATIHTAGQLVVYPVLPLREWQLSVRDYVCLLESAMIETCRKFGVGAWREEGAPGVYTSKGKIGFIGIRIKNGISRHGISFNVSNDLNYFNQIISCGRQQQMMDRLIDYAEVTTEETFKILSTFIKNSCASLQTSVEHESHT